MYLRDRGYGCPFGCRCHDEKMADWPAQWLSFSAFGRCCDLPGRVFMFCGRPKMADKFTVGESSSKRCQKSAGARSSS
jgi:hypothetical protein